VTDEGESVDKNDNACSFQHDRDADDKGGNSSSSDKEAAVLPVIELPSGPQKRMCDHLKELKWDFQPASAIDATVKDIEYYPFTNKSSLKEGVASSFSDLFDTFCRVGGLSCEFVVRIAANSNDHYHAQIKTELGQNRFHNLQWKDISTEEMYQFLGMLLKISLSPVDVGGYPAYFQPKNKELNTDFRSKKKTMVMLNSTGFAQKIMLMARFKQIRAAFHPKHKRVSDSGNKCYQLRAIINQLNAASISAFDPGPNLSFDKGGIACCSRVCPVRQCNKDKPDKYRVDFFVLADAKTYAVLHLDVYQGENALQVSVNEEAHGLTMTQRAVANAVLESGLHLKKRAGHKHITMDNRYQCPEVAVLLRERCRLYSIGTCREKRK